MGLCVCSIGLKPIRQKSESKAEVIDYWWNERKRLLKRKKPLVGCVYVKVILLKEWTPVESMTGEIGALNAVLNVSVPVLYERAKQAATRYSHLSNTCTLLNFPEMIRR